MFKLRTFYSSLDRRVGINDNNGRNSRRRYRFEYYIDDTVNRFYARNSFSDLFAEFSRFIGEYLVREICHQSIPVEARSDSSPLVIL